MALTDNLISFWKFDESSGNAADSVGSNTLTNNGSIPYVAGKINNAADLEASSSQYFSISDAAQSGLDLANTDFSVAGWFNRESDASQAILGKFNGDGGATDRSYALFLDILSSTDIGMNISNGTTQAWGAVSYTFNTGTDYFVAAVYDKTAGSVEFFVNGSSIGTATGLPTSGPYNNSVEFTIGAVVTSGGHSSYFDGLKDAWGIWSRKLSGAEVTALYNSGSGTQYPFGTSVTATPSVVTATLSQPSATITAVKNIAVTAAVLAATFSFGGSAGSVGPNSPSSSSQTVTAAIDWSNPSNVYSSDDSYATVSINGTDGEISEQLLLTGFDFNIPLGAQIGGIVVEIERHASVADRIRDAIVKLIKGGTVAGTNKASASNWPTNDSYATYGSQSDLWGQTWAYSDVNASDFGVALTVDNVLTATHTAYVDHIRITVTYVDPVASVTTTSNATVSPSVLALTASTPAASIVTDTAISVSPLTATFLAPSASVSTATNVTVSPDVLASTFSAPSSSVTAVQNVSTIAGPLVLSFAVQAASAAGDALFTPDAISLIATVPSSSISGDAATTAAVQTVTFGVQSPTVTTTSNVTVSVDTQTILASVPSPAIALDYAVAVSPQAATFSIPEPTVLTEESVVVSASVVSATLSLNSPTLAHDHAVFTIPLIATLTVPNPTISTEASVSVTASLLTLSASLPAVVVSTDASADAATLSATLSTASVTIAAEAVFSPDVQALQFSVPSPSIAVDFTVDANLLSLTSSIGPVQVSIDCFSTPSPLTMMATTNDVTITITVLKARKGSTILTTSNNVTVLQSKGSVVMLGTTRNKTPL